MAMLEQVKTLPLVEWMHLYDEEGPFEYVDGERIPVSPTNVGHNVIARTLLYALYEHDKSQKLW